ncbi:MAG: hypothetical protein P8H57_00800 [Emcibacteraceae bacterium]|nr:hypothetical protein [Emcibacteraceae bacterium]
MNNFNSFERAVAKSLSNFPFVKKYLKFIYSFAIYLKHKKDYKYRSKNRISIIFDKLETFFGYYDHCPDNQNFNIFNILHDTKKIPTKADALQVSIVRKLDLKLIYQVETFAFNLQQGARAHWLGPNRFIMNVFDKNTQSYGAEIHDVLEKKKIKKFSHCVQDSYANIFFVSINYNRLMCYRPDYGYRQVNASMNELYDYTNDGIFLTDMLSGNERLIVSLQDVIDFSQIDAKIIKKHWFNHVMISPDGSNIIFLHRYFDGAKRFDSLYLFSLADNSLKLLNNSGMISHYCWIDNETLFGYMRGPENREAYYYCNCFTGEFELVPELSQFGDGHPSFHSGKIVFDTYPGKDRMQQLFLFDTKTKNLELLGEFFHGFDFFGETRCDLHPRFSFCGSYVFFDTVFSGKRQLCKLEIS